MQLAFVKTEGLQYKGENAGFMKTVQFPGYQWDNISQRSLRDTQWEVGKEQCTQEEKELCMQAGIPGDFPSCERAVLPRWVEQGLGRIAFVTGGWPHIYGNEQYRKRGFHCRHPVPDTDTGAA